MTCSHEHTGSCSPNGVYLYVRCMDCGELLCVSDIGKQHLANCPGYEPKRTGYSRSCIHCGFDFHDHTIKNSWTANRPTIAGSYWVRQYEETRGINVFELQGILFTNEDGGAPVDGSMYDGAFWYGPVVVPAFKKENIE